MGKVTMCVCGVEQRDCRLIGGRRYVYAQDGSALQALETLQHIIEASGAEDAVILPYAPVREGGAQRISDALDRLAVSGFEGTVGILARCQHASPDDIVFLLLELANETAVTELPVVIALPLEGCAAHDVVRASLCCGLIPITAVRTPGGEDAASPTLPIPSSDALSVSARGGRVSKKAARKRLAAELGAPPRSPVGFAPAT